MHTSIVLRSPFFIEVEDPQRDLLDPAVKGTGNVLSSVAKHKKNVIRTIVTSSVAGAPHLPWFLEVSACCNTETHCVAAVLGNESAVAPNNGALYTEDDWNETSSIKNNEAYWLSKVPLKHVDSCTAKCTSHLPNIRTQMPLQAA